MEDTNGALESGCATSINFFSIFPYILMVHQVDNAPLLVLTSNGAPDKECASTEVFNSFFCKTTNGAPPEGAPLVTWITNGAFRVGAPLVSGQQQDILDSLSYPHSLSPHFILSTSSLSQVPPLFHLISTIDSFNLSG